MKSDELGRDYADGEVIFKQGEPGDVMYVIQSGRVRVSVHTTAGEVIVARTRLILAGLVLLIPVVDWLLPPRDQEVLVGTCEDLRPSLRAGTAPSRRSPGRRRPIAAGDAPARAR